MKKSLRKTPPDLDAAITTVRGQKVIPDIDLTTICGVTTCEREMVRDRGFEPLTPSVSRKCSTTELTAQSL
jgi:hypothetical protein